MTQNNTQELRERAIKELDTVPVFCDDNGDNWYLEKYVVDTMAQFASEVAAEKDKRIAELEIQVGALKQNAKARIAELEAVLSDSWLKTCIKDALLVASHQDEQWKDSDTARLALQKIKKEVPLEYLKENQ